MSITEQVGGIISGFLASLLHNPGVETGLRLAALALAVLWAAAIIWTFRDAHTRTHNVIAVLAAPTSVMLATPAAFPLAIVVWRILRPSLTIAQAREQQLTIEALRASAVRPTCSGCGSRVNTEWRRCPWCREWLQAPCPRCERLVDLSAAVCPWCVLDLEPGAPLRESVPSMMPVMNPAPMTPVMAAEAIVPVMAPAAMVPVMDPAPTTPITPVMPPEPVASLAPSANARAVDGATPEPTTDGTARGALWGFDGAGLQPPSPPVAAEAAIAPFPARSRRSRGRSNSGESRRRAEEPVRSSSALW